MIKIFIDGKMKAELPDNTNKDKFQMILTLYMNNEQIDWKKVTIEKVV